MSKSLTLNDFDDPRFAFTVAGDEMRTHKGRSVIMIDVDGQVHFLKRFWLTPSQLFKRTIARGFHELRMIDWLHGNGFAGPQVVRRGSARFGPVITGMFFLMARIPDESALEATWRSEEDESERLVSQLASFAARLHESGFVHTDFSERHIFVGRASAGFQFRLIDVERAGTDIHAPARAAADIATLHASILNDELKQRITGPFLDTYLTNRPSLNGHVDFRSLVANAKPTKDFY